MTHTLFRRMVTPGAFRPKAVLVAAILAMAVLLALDLLTNAEIRLHVLYVFPLAAIALHCEDSLDVLAGLVLSLICQLFTAVVEGIALTPLATDAVVFLASSLLVVFLARAVRENFFDSAGNSAAGPADPLAKASRGRAER